MLDARDDVIRATSRESPRRRRYRVTRAPVGKVSHLLPMQMLNDSCDISGSCADFELGDDGSRKGALLVGDLGNGEDSARVRLNTRGGGVATGECLVHGERKECGGEITDAEGKIGCKDVNEADQEIGFSEDVRRMWFLQSEARLRRGSI